MRRSMLFLPGNAPNMIINGGTLRADSVILDLEDSVAPGEKDAARILVRNALRTVDFGCETIVRINSLDSEFCEEDLKEIVPCAPGAIMSPKSSRREDILRLDDMIERIEEENHMEKGKIKLIPLIETALGVENAFEIASSCGRVTAIFLGGEDLSADLRCKRTTSGEEILYARERMVCAARAAGVEVYDTPFTDAFDDEGLIADAKLAKSLGFSGKAAVAPRHVYAINEIFSPTKEEIDYAKEVMGVIEEAHRLGKGAVSLHGKMIDPPIVERARLVLEAAESAERRGFDE